MTRTRRRTSGQALIETAITIPVLLVLMLGFLLVMVVAQAYVELDTATSLAAASAVSAPANSSASYDFAKATYEGTLLASGYLQPGKLTGCGAYAPGTNGIGSTVACTGTATLNLSATPMAILEPWNPNWTMQLSATATGYSSPFRST